MHNTLILNNEIWRPVPTWEEYYEISNFGRLRRLHKTASPSLVKPKRRKQYLAFHLTAPGREKYLSAHRAVATIFVPNPLDKAQVNHIDGNPHNNLFSNLEWVNNSENCLHRNRVLRKCNDNIKKAHMKNRRPIKCLETGECFVKIQDAGDKYNICASSISAVALHHPKHKTAGGFHWEYI